MKIYVHIKICTQMFFIAALFMGAKRWTQFRCASMDEQINKTWSVQTVEYYSARKRSEVRRNLENVTLNEGSQSQKIMGCVILFMQKSRLGKSRETESTSVIFLGMGGRECWRLENYKK